MEPRPGTRKGSVEFDIVVYGEDGTKLNVLRQTANVTLKQQEVADFQAKPFEVPLQLDLPPGKLFVRVGALDVLSGKAGTLEVSLTVAKPISCCPQLPGYAATPQPSCAMPDSRAVVLENPSEQSTA